MTQCTIQPRGPVDICPPELREPPQAPPATTNASNERCIESSRFDAHADDGTIEDGDEPSGEAGQAHDAQAQTTRRATNDDARRYALVDNRSVQELLVQGSRAAASLGNARDVTSTTSHRITLRNETEARNVFSNAADRLLDVSTWGEGLGVSSSDFKLYDSQGQPVVGRGATEGDFVRVDLPGPAPMAWVQVEHAEISENRVSIRVRPSYDPTQEPLSPNETAHFFDSRATNTFTIQRRGENVRFAIEGRGESPNTGEETRGVVDPLVNRGVAQGAWGVDGFSMQHEQWDDLTRHLLESARADARR